MTYKITKKEKRKAFADRKSNLGLKIIAVILTIIFLGLIFKSNGEMKVAPLIFIFLFIGGLFYFLFSSLKKLMWFIAKNISYVLTEEVLLVQQNMDNETGMGFIENYLYQSGKRKGGYKDVTIKYDKMTSIIKNNKGDLILKTNLLLMRKIIIPREIENLRDLENQIRVKIKK